MFFNRLFSGTFSTVLAALLLPHESSFFLTVNPPLAAFLRPFVPFRLRFPRLLLQFLPRLHLFLCVVFCQDLLARVL